MHVLDRRWRMAMYLGSFPIVIETQAAPKAAAAVRALHFLRSSAPSRRR